MTQPFPGKDLAVNRMGEALTATIELAARKVEEHRELRAFARPERSWSWQSPELQHFFMAGIFQMLTGADRAINDEITRLVLTPEAEEWLGSRCLNPYWLWSVINAAAAQAKALPLTLADVSDGAQEVFDAHAKPMGVSMGVSGWPYDYSGPVTPWHTRNALSRMTLWNNDHDREAGLKYGFLMMQRHRHYLSMDGMRIVFNPLFEHLTFKPFATSCSC